MERLMKCHVSMNLAFPVYRLGKKNMKNAPTGVQNACSSYEPLKNLLRNDKKCFLWVIMVSHAKPLRGYIVRPQNSFIGFIAGLTTLTV